jgi:F0F1-type ATP synthase assembly protein I
MSKPEPAGQAGGENGDKPVPVEDQAPANQWLSLLNLGWVFLVTMGLCVFGGLWVDKRFGTAPLFILIGVFLGFAASGYSFYQTMKKLNGDGNGKHQE